MRGVFSGVPLGVIWVLCALSSSRVEARLAPYAARSLVLRGGSDAAPPAPPVAISETKESTLPQTVSPPEPKQKKSSAKWENAKQRTLPAVIMIAALTAWIKILGDKGVIALVVLIQALLYSEATTVTNIKGIAKWWWFLYGFVGTTGCALMTEQADALKLLSYCMATVGIVGFVVNLNTPGNNAESFKEKLGEAAGSHLALLVLVQTTSYWISTLKDFGLRWILYPALLVVINDTMAYVFGMIWGNHPLLPVISPKKTWEGFVGATLSTVILSIPLGNLIVANKESSAVVLHALVMATYISLISPFGGFLASIAKRAHGEKDFGNLIPGHGGVVDRLDCQVVTAPFVYLYLKIML